MKLWNHSILKKHIIKNGYSDDNLTKLDLSKSNLTKLDSLGNKILCSLL